VPIGFYAPAEKSDLYPRLGKAHLAAVLSAARCGVIGRVYSILLDPRVSCLQVSSSDSFSNTMFIPRLLHVAFFLINAGAIPSSLGTSQEPLVPHLQDLDFIEYYNCTDRANGNYYHPCDCTKFITCSNGYATERDCAACNPGDKRCPDGRTNFDEPSDACLWPDVARCLSHGCADTPPAPWTAGTCEEEGFC
jgi:hypothetical protein